MKTLTENKCFKLTYNNSYNDIEMGSFTPYELDMLISILYTLKQAREENMAEITPLSITYSVGEMRKLLGADLSEKHYNNEKFAERLRILGKKLTSLNCEYQMFDDDGNEIKWGFCALFIDFVVDAIAKNCKITINPSYEYLLMCNNQFTRIDLKEYKQLKSVPAKLFYQRLMQWYTNGSVPSSQMQIDKLRAQLGIPDSVPDKDLAFKYFKPAVAQIQKLNSFKGKSVRLKTNRDGRKAVSYTLEVTDSSDSSAKSDLE